MRNISYLIEQADARGYNLPIIKSARNFNLNLAKDYAYFIHEEITLLVSDKPKAIIIYGLSFKSNSKDVKNSQAISLTQTFLQLNYHVTISDPNVKKADFQEEWLKINNNPMPNNIRVLSHNRAFSKSNATEYDVVIVALNHKHYRDKSARRFQMQVAPQGLLIDLQNTLPELSNWENYRSI